MAGLDDLSIGQIFSNAAQAVPHRMAVAVASASLTFGQLDAKANQYARALSAQGITRGTRVVLWSATNLDAVPLFAATSKIGALFIPVNGLLSPEEALPIIDDTKATLIVTDVERAFPDAAPAHTTLSALNESCASESTNVFVNPDVVSSDPHVAFFTSGSTGRPKGAVLSHGTNFLRTSAGALLEPRGPMVCPFPLFHMAAWTISLQQWQGRDAVIFPASSSAEDIYDAVTRTQATRINCIPAIWRRLIEHIANNDLDPLSSIRLADTGTSATPLELLEAIERTVPNAHLRVFYGSTEAGSVAFLDHDAMRSKPGSCGPPAPTISFRLVDGELWTKSPTLFDEYLNNEEATKTALVDGWYRTGDLAELDSDGYLSIVGRAGDLIRTGGESVIPGEVEEVLSALPAVAEIAVVGLPDPTWGEVICAVVVCKSGEEPPTLEELRAFCEERLAPFKHPRALRILDALPRTASTGQIQRRLLVERLSN